MKVYISLGSNLGDRAAYLLLGVRGMMDAGLPVKRLSNVYESEPVGTFAQPYFLNMVAEVEGDNLPEPEPMMARLLRIEHALGRKRDRAKGPRVIDLDLLLYGNRVGNSELLVLPHSRLHLRRFVLQPLAELAPDLIHPTLGDTVRKILEKVDDQSAVHRWPKK